MYRRILVALDGSVPGARALLEAIQLARAFRSQLRLIAIQDFKSLLPAGPDEIDVASMDEAARMAGQRVLDQGVAAAQAARLEVETALVEPKGRSVSTAIVDEAGAWNADLIVIGTHGRHGLGHLLLGSVAEEVARTAPVPVLLVRHAERTERAAAD